MVKGRGSSSSSERPACPPLASLSLVLKPSRPSPLFTLLKRPPFVHTEPPMDSASPRACSSPPSPSLSEVEAYPSHALKEELNTEDGDMKAGASRRYSNLVSETPSLPDEDDDGEEKDTPALTCGRQRLQQHRIEMSGNVDIPDTWGREQQLQEWVSYGIVEDALRPAGLMSARTALVSECQRRESKPVRTSPAMSADVEVS